MATPEIQKDSIFDQAAGVKFLAETAASSTSTSTHAAVLSKRATKSRSTPFTTQSRFTLMRARVNFTVFLTIAWEVVRSSFISMLALFTPKKVTSAELTQRIELKRKGSQADARRRIITHAAKIYVTKKRMERAQALKIRKLKALSDMQTEIRERMEVAQIDPRDVSNGTRPGEAAVIKKITSEYDATMSQQQQRQSALLQETSRMTASVRALTRAAEVEIKALEEQRDLQLARETQREVNAR